MDDRLSHRVTVRLSVSDFEKLNGLAQAGRLTHADIMRRALLDYSSSKLMERFRESLLNRVNRELGGTGLDLISEFDP